MNNEQFKKELDAYRHAKYDIVEEFEIKLYDCFEDLVPLENDTFEHFDYYEYDDEFVACSDFKDNACYIITVPGYIISMWFEGKKDEAKAALEHVQKQCGRYCLRRE